MGPSAAVKLTNRHHPNFSRSRTFYCLMLRHADILRHRALDPLFGEQRNNKFKYINGTEEKRELFTLFTFFLLLL